MTIQLSSDRVSPVSRAVGRAVFGAAATRTAATPTAALAQAIDTGAVASGVAAVSRLSPRGGSFDPPTAAAVTAWRKA